jgi:ribosomal protein L7/L12
MPSENEINRLRNEISGEEEIETTFRRLRQDGHSRLEAVQMILEVLGVSLADAKRLFAGNDTWADAWAEADTPPDSPSPDGPPPAPG